MARTDGNFTGLELNYEDLPEQTKYRFAELEIGRAIHSIAQFIPLPNPQIIASQYIFRQIQSTFTAEDEDNWLEVFSSWRLVKGEKEELATYFRYRNISYTNTRKAIGLSPNTISKYRFINPYYYTKYPKWDSFMLFKWNSIKSAINIWNQELYHKNK